MRRLVERLVTRWQQANGLRRAFGETLADWQLEETRAPTPLARASVSLAAALACLRVLMRRLPGLPGEALFRNVGRDFLYALRRLRATPVFTIFSVVSLALGIGAATAAYSAVRVAAGPPPGIEEPDRLIRVRHYPWGSIPIIGLAWADYVDLRARQTVFDGLAAWGGGFRPGLVANSRSHPGVTETVSGDYFTTLGVAIARGRALRLSDDDWAAPPVAVISYGAWQRLFDGAPDVVGRTVKIQGVTFEVVGVVSRSFAGMFNGGMTPTAAWVPISTLRLLPGGAAQLTLDPSQRSNRWLFLAGRLARGRTLDEARAQITAIAKQLDTEWPIGADIQDPRSRRPYRVSRPWDVQALSGRVEAAAGGFWIEWVGRALLVAVALVLLIACTNLANLMLARHSTRRHEFAVRLALGASRWRLVREVLAESILLVLPGALAGLAVARTLIHLLGGDLQIDGGRFFLRLAPALDVTALGVCAAATAGSLLVFGVVPAWRAARADARSALGVDGAGSVSGRWRGRRMLIALQVTVSVLLASLATLYLVEIRAAGRVEFGIDTDRLAVMDVDFRSQQYDEPRTRRVVDAVLQQIAAHPDAEAAAASSGLPSDLLTDPGGRIGVENALTAPVNFLVSTPAVFDTLGVRIVRGRAFDQRDSAGTEAVAVVTETAALQVFGSIETVGRAVAFQRTRSGESPHPVRRFTIIGVAASPPSSGPGSPNYSAVYVPWAQHYEGNMAFSARTAGDPARLLGVLRDALRRADPELAPTRVAPATSLGSLNTLFPRITASIASVLGALALVLALAGLYGVLAHLVAGRTREIGIRLALGAPTGRIRRQVLLQGMSPVLLGLIGGLGLLGAALPVLPSLFARLVPGVDLAVLAVVPVVFIAAGLAACYLPALRASRVDPNVALRNP
jgi:predicted permease